jgi:hypothetical protein
VSKNSAVSSAKDAEPEARPRVVPRWGNKTATSIHAGFSVMTLHRVISDPDENFPEPSEVKGLKLYSFDEVDIWLRGKKRKAATNTNND